MMSALAKDKQFPALKKRGGVCSPSNHEFRQKEGHWRSKHSVSTVSYSDQPRQQYETSPFTVHMKNTYQLGPTKYFPVATVNRILKDVLTAYLQEAKYDPEFCKQMTKTISEVIKAQVKELMIPRYKLIVIVYIGQRDCQSILIASRCLWDPKSDTVSSYTFTNSTLFAVANVYGVYFE
ncbi:tctex1 domain-containing protein 1 isoform X1 [Cricetulus griseus]|uniref:Tctex1 domain-containing protein 1 isoform X1 n=2 Tax=Cricetulus griseus TaxID=10029 RepID=A0A9J7K3U9_CRIGR|nr:tctex1 domain-containing protein 1 isoform X1 [Cricetulus griseus]XP_035313004.1 tctex1 domain-containing protein 1 isoform X1 [Cricetulus griseus]ERE85675.1 tctex1 domain-containing protein 1 [Cricetulus griseus]